MLAGREKWSLYFKKYEEFKTADDIEFYLLSIMPEGWKYGALSISKIIFLSYFIRWNLKRSKIPN